MSTHATIITAAQAAIYTALSNESQLTSIVHGIYDDVPQDAPLPYIVLADWVYNDISTRHITITQAAITLSIWSSYAGSAELADISAQIQSILVKENILFTGGRIVSMVLAQQQMQHPRDAVTRDISLTYRLTIEHTV